MKKNIVVYGIFAVIYAVLSVVLTSKAMEGVELILRFFISLAASSLVLISANLILNYRKGASIKTCFGHALLLAIVACIIALAIDGLSGSSDGGSSVVSESTEKVADENTVDGDNDIQIDVAFSDQDISSRIMQIILDTFIAFIGGIAGFKLFKKRNYDPNAEIMG